MIVAALASRSRQSWIAYQEAEGESSSSALLTPEASCVPPFPPE